MPEPHLLIGAYALDALDDLERAAVDRHLADCPDCRAELADFREVATRLADRVATAPPPGLRAKVLAAVRDVRQLPPAARGPRRRPPRRFALVAAAAVLLVAGVGAVGGLAWQGWSQARQARVEAARVTDVLTDPGRREALGRPTVGGSVTVVSAHGEAVVATRGLPAPPAGRTYQVWVVQGERIRSAGLLDLDDGAGRSLVQDVPAGSAIAVSVEPEGGSEQPTTTPVVAVEL